MVQCIHYNQVNEVMNGEKDLDPKVGMCGTEFVGSDRYMVVCVEVKSPKRVVVANIYSEFKDKIITDENGVMWLPEEYLKNIRNTIVYSKRKNHRWMQEGTGMWGTGSILFGHADEYRDPCF